MLLKLTFTRSRLEDFAILLCRRQHGVKSGASNVYMDSSCRESPWRRSGAEDPEQVKKTDEQ